MRIRSTAELAELCAGSLIGDPGTAVGPGVVIDSRRVGPGDLFVALPGSRVDGAEYIGAAAQAGAGAALTARRVDAAIPQILVADAQTGLQNLARGSVAEAIRQGLVVCALTGSSGKTSTKDLLAQVLAGEGPTVAPAGSQNNELGLPLTACRVDEQTRFLVCEMGTRGPGHITLLCDIVPPRIAAVLNIGSAHLGEFGSREAIARAKGEILAGLDENGWAVLNADDPLVAGLAASTPARTAWFSATGGRPPGVDAELVVTAHHIDCGDLDRHSFDLQVERDQVVERHRVTLQVPGAHQVDNACAAAAMALAAGLGAGQVAAALSAATARSHWRMEIHQLANGAAVINDSYNANPESTAAALHSLARIGATRRAADPAVRTIAVLGQMAELGDRAAELHAGIGALAARLGVDELVCVGPDADSMASAARAAGGRARVAEARTVADSVQLNRGDVVLVKASRALAFDTVAAQLIDRAGGEEKP